MSTYGNNLFAQYYAQNQYEPIIRDGLVFYAPLRTLTDRAYTGQHLNIHADSYIETVDGITGLVGLVYTDALDFSSIQSVTLSAWGNIHRWVAWKILFGLSDLNSSEKHPGIRLGGVQQYPNMTYVYFQQHESFYTPVDAIMNQWKHNLLTFDAQTRTLKTYSNGALTNTKTLDFDLALTDQTTVRTGNATDMQSQTVTALRVYNRVLSQDEITMLAREFTPTP